VKVFVYGTLRVKESNHHYLKKAKILAWQCWVEGELYDTGFGYPAMVRSKKGRVYGELYLITEEELKSLDYLEDCLEDDNPNNEYNRLVETVYTDQGEEQAYVYVFPPEKIEKFFRLIESGDWKDHRL